MAQLYFGSVHTSTVVRSSPWHAEIVRHASPTVPQGSVLIPILFIMYTADLVLVAEQRGFCPHLYADDTRVYGFSRPQATRDLQERLSACIDDVYSWMQSNCLQLNASKSELLWCATTRRQCQLPRPAFRIATDTITPSATVRDLGIYIDTDLSMKPQVQRTVASCFAMLRQLRSIRRSVPLPVYQTLIVSLVLTRLDYGNATLTGIFCRPTQPSPVGTERCGLVNRWLTSLGSYHSLSGQSSLASCTRTNHVQARGDRLPRPARHSSSILVGSTASSRRHAVAEPV